MFLYVASDSSSTTDVTITGWHLLLLIVENAVSCAKVSDVNYNSDAVMIYHFILSLGYGLQRMSGVYKVEYQQVTEVVKSRLHGFPIPHIIGCPTVVQ